MEHLIYEFFFECIVPSFCNRIFCMHTTVYLSIDLPNYKFKVWKMGIANSIIGKKVAD